MTDLTKFCGEQGRYDLSKPFYCGDGWQGATDGRFAIRIPCDKSIQKTPDTPNFAAIFPPRVIMESAHIPIDESLFKPMTKDSPSRVYSNGNCPYCHGTGVETTECKACEGTGERADGEECEHCGEIPSCENCSGKGYFVSGAAKCQYCANGVKFEEMVFGSKRFDGSRIKYMQVNAPGLEVIPASFSKTAPLAFWFPEGEAVLMSLVDKY